MISEYKLFDVDSTSDPQDMCEFCGNHPARIDGQWCSLTCRFNGEHELRTAPSTDEIEKRKKIIQSEWNERIELKRREGEHNQSSGSFADNDESGWRPPTVFVGTID